MVRPKTPRNCSVLATGTLHWRARRRKASLTSAVGPSVCPARGHCAAAICRSAEEAVGTVRLERQYRRPPTVAAAWLPRLPEAPPRHLDGGILVDRPPGAGTPGWKTSSRERIG